ncbi:hypothetical protein [Microbacterium sp. NPDC056569]|uniref:hypothetical protein n=1 Tax=Microbacterium sp. NPDC056569 TaxID=3345867 RepID=UPI00366FA85E
MRFARSGRFVYVAQWVAAIGLPLFVFFGRVEIGAQPGWLVILGPAYAAVAIAVSLIPPLLTRFDGEGRRLRATRLGYDVAAIILWSASVIGALTLTDAGDSPEPLRSALMSWTAVSAGTSSTVFTTSAAIIVLAYLATLVLAITGIVRGRSGKSAAPAPTPPAA